MEHRWAHETEPAVDPAGAIFAALDERQFVRPHQPLGEAVAVAAARVGFCAAVSERAIQWLTLNPTVPIGRLRRTELIQLARCIDRYWRSTLRQPQPGQRRDDGAADADAGGVIIGRPNASVAGRGFRDR